MNSARPPGGRARSPEDAPEGPGARLRAPKGRALREKAYARVSRASAEIHEGIPEAEFVAAPKVLRRMIHNVGGKAWHH